MLYISLFLLSLLCTYIIREIAKKRSFLDMPNARSSHDIPTPKGGGVAVIATFYIGLWFVKESIEPRLFHAFWFGLLIAIISLIDDMVELSSKVRLFVQGVAIIGAMYSLGGIDRIDLGCCIFVGWWLNIIAFLGMLWIVNLYNFMDGIDGYVSIETMVLGFALWIFFHQTYGWILIAAVGGFLIFNWHKASIFMGDVGSATLGFIVAVSMSYYADSPGFSIWLVLLMLFLYDATITLVRRYRNHEPITQAHRKHAYQRLVQSGWSHSKVTIALLLVNFMYFALLYVVKPKVVVLFFALMLTWGIMYYIDRKKAFQ